MVSTNTSCTFVAGKVKYCYNNWKNIKNDRFILDIVKHALKFGFENKSQLDNAPKIPHNAQAESITNFETSNLLRRDSLPNVKKNRMTLFLPFSQGRRRMAHLESSWI